jgi:predicted dehydrogenase
MPQVPGVHDNACMNSANIMGTRREFLLGSAALGASAVSATAAEPLRVAIYGTQHSHVLGKLAAMQKSPNFRVVGVCEPELSALPRLAREPLLANLPRLTERQLLDHPEIQMVIVECAVWNAIPYATKVIAAGKHLHLEKPPTDKMEPFQLLVEEARRQRLLLQMGYIWRFHQGMAAGLEAVRQGWLGNVYMMRATANSDLDEATRAAVGRYRGGMMFELAGHFIDRMVDLWGRPKHVKTWLRHDTSVPDAVADNTLAVFEYDNALAVISSAAKMSGASVHRSFELIGTDGSFVLQPVEPGTSMRVHMREARGPYKKGWQEIIMPAQLRYGKDLEAMAMAIQSKQPLQYSYDFELLLQETILRACEKS